MCVSVINVHVLSLCHTCCSHRWEGRSVEQQQCPYAEAMLSVTHSVFACVLCMAHMARMRTPPAAPAPSSGHSTRFQGHVGGSGVGPMVQGFLLSIQDKTEQAARWRPPPLRVKHTQGTHRPQVMNMSSGTVTSHSSQWLPRKESPSPFFLPCRH